ncbi:lamin tail domain-containing protein [Chryseolinea sp. H1M3-3]|uniref:lamin tail domain-containing protein n=1 Tax=Chryseolinea sp. H1M3-3 TaxID=3034144 RepID=UPI0023EDBAB3|nr:lamin tail domain-containing protein [Chryseolinea sp. H1M3-3]
MKKKKQICWLSNLQTFTAKISLLIVLLFLGQQAFAQFLEDFSDNDFLSSPPWSGTDSLFKIVDQRLHLHAPQEGGHGYLSTSSSVARFGSWELNLAMDFNPSGSNYTRVYLVASEPDLTKPLNGYYVMAGGSDDDVSLYKQNGLSHEKIIDGQDKVLNVPTVVLKLKVIRDESGWQLFTSVDTTGEYKLEGISDDNSILNSKYFGIVCSYTATRSDKFSFDDFRVQGGTVQDTTSPTLTRFEVVSAQQINLIFSERLDPKTIRTENFIVDHEVGNPVSVTMKDDENKIMLTFARNFPNSEYAVLIISGVQDTAGNVMAPVEKRFLHLLKQAAAKDVIITEIFPDPTPSVGLPESEFVEIYNRSSNAFNLANWTLTDQSEFAILPDFTILPREYVILTSQNVLFQDGEKILKLDNFPNLNNARDVLILKDEKENVIDSINYSDLWYNDEEKRAGGYTIEIIDPDNTCAEHKNWRASEDEQGGTPGFQNSIFASNPDLTGPSLTAAIPITASVIELHFNEKLQKPLSPTITAIIDPPIGIENISFSNAALTSLYITLSQEIETGKSYSISLEKIYDCTGNGIEKDNASAAFGLPQQADTLDVLVNEILFNPRPTGVDFVEIFNNSKKYLNLKGWSVATMEDGVIKDKQSLPSENFLFKPGAFLAVTENPNVLKGEYILGQEKNFILIQNLPTLNDDEGSVVLLDNVDNVISYFNYTKEMHSIFLKDDEGVSLERISTQDIAGTENWKSASGSVGYATPGYMNSNAIADLTLNADAIKVTPEIFNPMASQFNFALIHYNFPQGGHVANIKILGPQGHLIKELANNDILGTSGFYRWDGDRDDGTKANIGYYMIWFEVFDQQGGIKRYQNRVAIAASF